MILDLYHGTNLMSSPSILWCVDPGSQRWQLSLWLTRLTPCLSHGSPGIPNQGLPTAQHGHRSPKTRAPHCPFQSPHPLSRASVVLEGKALASPNLPASPVLFPLHCQAVFRSFCSVQEWGQKQALWQRWVMKVCSTLGTPVLALPIPLSLVADLAQAFRSLGRNSHSSSFQFCWQDKARQGVFSPVPADWQSFAEMISCCDSGRVEGGGKSVYGL